MAREQFADTQIPAAGKDAVPYATWAEIVRTLGQHVGEMAFGTVTGTGANIVVATPFDPAMVVVINETDGSMHVHIPTMTAADVFAIKTAAVAYISTGGITLGTKQFTIGTDADLNTNSDVLHWAAFGARNVNGSS